MRALLLAGMVVLTGCGGSDDCDASSVTGSYEGEAHRTGGNCAQTLQLLFDIKNSKLVAESGCTLVADEAACVQSNDLTCVNMGSSIRYVVTYEDVDPSGASIEATVRLETRNQSTGALTCGADYQVTLTRQ